MKSKKSLVAIVSVILFLAVLLLGANTVFSVTHVEIAYALSSSQAYEDSLSLQKKLEEEFVGDNILFIQKESVLSHFDDYAYLKVANFEKVYPNKIRLSVEEKLEQYALAVEENGKTVYYMADAQGDILRKSDVNVNNVDGGENLLIEGLRYSAESGFNGDSHFATVIQVCAQMEELTGGVRTCLTRMEISSNAVRTDFSVYTQEGVVINIYNPAQSTDKKITSAINLYLSLDDKDKLYGYITVLDDVNQEGEIVGPTYTPRD